MDIFKTKQGISKIYNIKDDYLSVTGKKAPYCIQGAKKDSFYAVCPACDNPIQIIGLYKNTIEAGKKPYGRHHKGNLSFAPYDEFNYISCPYSKPTWSKENRKRKVNSPLGKSILDLLISQFDRIIYILSQDTDIKISAKTAEDMLRNFIKEEGWLYRDIHSLNLPWMFTQTIGALPLFGRLIKINSDLYNTLKTKCPEITLCQHEHEQEYAQIKMCGKTYCQLYFLFYNHKIKKIDDTNHENANETIDFWVYRGPVPNPKTIYKKTITIRMDYFHNLINSTRHDEYRNAKLLEIANNVKDSLIKKS